jgi:6-phosphogluconate dehydrogenase
MGANMVRRLTQAGHQCVVYDVDPKAVNELSKSGAVGTASLAALVSGLKEPRAIWLMVPAALVDRELAALSPLLARGDIVIDGGNSHYLDDLRRGRELKARGVHYVDVGTSGGVMGIERGYCLMIGGDAAIVGHLDPIFAALAPGSAESSGAGHETNEQRAESGYLHCGPQGAGHFVKMVHNGIEYGVMAAYAEGLNILRHANIGKRSQESDAETTPLRNPEYYQFDLDLPEIAEVWRHGSVISSWLLDLTAKALREDSNLGEYAGRVSDSGEGRWTLAAALDEGVPAPVISAALFERFQSRGNADYADRVLSAMRKQFGGHQEKK